MGGSWDISNSDAWNTSKASTWNISTGRDWDSSDTSATSDWQAYARRNNNNTSGSWQTNVNQSSDLDCWQPTPQEDERPLHEIIASIGYMKFDEVPSFLLAPIGSLVLETPIADIEEVRACRCLTARVPFRSGTTTFLKDLYTDSDIRQDTAPCGMDTGKLAPWCLKPDFYAQPGHKHIIPTFAVANKMLYKRWRDATAYVFCSETCLETAVQKLPIDNLRIMTKVRFFEHDDRKNTIAKSYESYPTGLVGEKEMLVYKSNGMTRILYKGEYVWVKELELKLKRLDV